MATSYYHDMDQITLTLLGLLSLGAAAYFMLLYLFQPRYPRGYSYRNNRMDLGDGGETFSVPVAVQKLFSQYG